MKKPAGSIFLCFTCCLLAAAASPISGQSVPAQTGSPIYNGFEMPDVNGSLHYAISAGERLSFGYYSPTVSTTSSTTLSGDVGLITPSITKPTSLAYSGGYLANTGGIPSSFFHDFSISQAYNTKNWKSMVGDQVRYLPESQASGISGVIGVGTTTGTASPQGVLIPYASRLQNSVNGDITRQLTGKTSLDATGHYLIDRFLGNSTGIETNDALISGGVIHRINPLITVSGTYNYNSFTYVGITGQFVSQGGSFMYKRQLTRSFSFSLAAGPQYIDSSSLNSRPATLSYTADLTASYTGSAASGLTATASYRRATIGGSGITYGALNDTFSGSIARRLTLSLHVDALFNYSRSQGLQLLTATPINTQTVLGTIQANRAFTRTLSAYVSYSGLQQSIEGYTNTGINPLNGVRQILGFGVTYSPSPVHLGR
jgi:hypothetical protein